MARHLRVEYPGALYHVTARGNDRGAIFETVEDRVHLLEVLAEGLERFEVRLYAYVLLDNHYHAVLETEHPNLNRFMHYVNTAYTVWMNRRNRRTGHLFEGPYRAVVMEKEGYLLAVTGYVHLNPVRMRGWKTRPVAERLERVASYLWSSYGAYTRRLPKGSVPTVTCDRVWGELGARTVGEGRRHYATYIKGWLEKEAEERKKPKQKRDDSVFNPLSETRMGCMLGGDRFRDFVQALTGPERELSQEIVGRRQWRREVSIDDLLSAITATRGVPLDALQQRRRPHPERDVAIYLCREAGKRTLKEVGRAFGIGPAAAGHASTRVKEKMAARKAFRQAIRKAHEAVMRLLET